MCLLFARSTAGKQRGIRNKQRGRGRGNGGTGDLACSLAAGAGFLPGHMISHDKRGNTKPRQWEDTWYKGSPVKPCSKTFQCTTGGNNLSNLRPISTLLRSSCERQFHTWAQHTHAQRIYFPPLCEASLSHCPQQIQHLPQRAEVACSFLHIRHKPRLVGALHTCWHRTAWPLLPLQLCDPEQFHKNPYLDSRNSTSLLPLSSGWCFCSLDFKIPFLTASAQWHCNASHWLRHVCLLLLSFPSLDWLGQSHTRQLWRAGQQPGLHTNQQFELIWEVVSADRVIT